MARSQATRAVISILRVIGLIIAGILILHVILVGFAADKNNGLYQVAEIGAKFFDLGLTDPFLFPVNGDIRWQTGVNFGIAAVVWLLITNIVTGVVRRVG